MTSQSTRAVLARNDLDQLLGAGPVASRVVEKLLAARLLVGSENDAGAETVEIVHEALLVAWPRLVEWRRDDAEGARFREQLRTAAEQWHERGRAKGLLWRGDALGDYTRWRARHPGPLTDTEAAFAHASLTDAARSRRSRRLLLATAFVALAAVVVGLVVFNAKIAGERSRAQTAARDLEQNLQKQYEDTGRRLVLAGDPFKGLAYLAEAGKSGAHGVAHDFLIAEAVRATDGRLLEVHHADAIRSPHFSHDGNTLVTASYDNTARIWDSHTGALLATLPHGDHVSQALFTPDDRRVVTGDAGGDVAVWDALTGAKQHALHVPGRAVCVALSPDGSRLAAGAGDALVVAEVATGAELSRAQITSSDVFACAFSPDGRWLATAHASGATELRDAATCAVVRTFPGEPTLRPFPHFSTDGAVLATVSGSEAHLWDVATGKLAQTLAHQGPVKWVELSPDGKLVATASDDRTAALWDAATGKRRFVLAGHASNVNAAHFTSDGGYLVTTSGDASAQLWDVASGRSIAHWRGHRAGIAAAPDIDRDDKRLVTASEDGTAIIWNLVPQVHEVWLQHGGVPVADGRFSPDGKRVVFAGRDGVAIADAETGAIEQRIEVSAMRAAFSPDGRWLAIASTDGSVRLWDPNARAPVASLAKKGASAGTLAWAPDGTWLVSGDDEGWIRAWDLASRTLRFETRLPADVFGVAFSRDGNVMVAVSGHPVQTLTPQGKPIAARDDTDLPNSLELDPSGHRMVMAVARQRGKLVDLASSKVVWLDGHTDEVLDATWSPDGALVATASLDGTARIWDAEQGALLETIAHAGPVWVARFSPAGDRVIVGGVGGAAIYDLPRLRDASELSRVLACLPFAWSGDHPEPRAADWRGCRR